jgi:ABC-type branched-subunit amino acid transport system substrate-binding protein
MKFLSLYFAIICISTNLYAEQILSGQSKLKFGMLLTLSGNYAVAGEDQRIGINEALKSNQTSSVDLVYADSLNDPKTGMSELHKMIMVDKVSAVYLNRAKVAIPLNKTSKENKMPLIGCVGHDDFVPGNEYAFQVWPKALDEGGFLAKNTIENGAKKVAVIYAEDEYLSSLSRSFKDTVLALNKEVVLFESILAENVDVRSLVLKAKSKNPDTIYINVSVPQIGPIVKQIRELGIQANILSNLYVAKEEVLNSASSELFEGIRFVDVNTELPILKKSLGIAENKSIAGLTLSAYVGTTLLLQTSADLKSGEDFYNALLRQKEVRTADYNYKIEDRYVKFPLVIKKIVNRNSVVEN